MNEQQLVDRILKADPEAFREFYDSYKKALIRACWPFLGNDSEAEAIVRETYVEALKNLSGFGFEPPLETWLNHIAVNLCRDFLKKKKKTFPFLSANVPGQIEAPDEKIIERISLRVDQRMESIWLKHKPSKVSGLSRRMSPALFFLVFLFLGLSAIYFFWSKLLIILPQIDLAGYGSASLPVPDLKLAPAKMSPPEGHPRQAGLPVSPKPSVDPAKAKPSAASNGVASYLSYEILAGRFIRVIFNTTEAQTVDLGVLDSMGGELRHLYNGLWSNGTHFVVWDGKDDAGNAVLPGNYLVVVKAGHQIQSKAVTITN